MEIDLEKKVNLVDACAMVVKLSEKHLDNDSTKHLKEYLDKMIETEEIWADEDDDPLESLGRPRALISNMISNIPKRIDRLVELKAPQVIIDMERAVLESLQKLNNNLS